MTNRKDRTKILGMKVLSVMFREKNSILGTLDIKIIEQASSAVSFSVVNWFKFRSA
jgi:hypothetical protein